LLAFVLVDAGRDPSFLIGGVPLNFGSSFRLGKGEHFVVEGDEYDTAFFDKGSKFFHYQPKSAILTSVELDHVDIFKSFADVKTAFEKFVRLTPHSGRLVVAASSPDAVGVTKAAACTVETYAVAQDAMWRAKVQEVRRGGRTIAEITRGGEPFILIETGLPGN